MIRDALAFFGAACFACLLVAGASALLVYARWADLP